MTDIAERALEESGNIYFVEATGLGLVKIGWAKHDVIGRIVQLTTGCPVRLELKAVAVGRPKDERKAHRHFAHTRKHGEWFKVSPALRAVMERHALSATVYFMGSDVEPPWSQEIVDRYDDPEAAWRASMGKRRVLTIPSPTTPRPYRPTPESQP